MKRKILSCQILKMLVVGVLYANTVAFAANQSEPFLYMASKESPETVVTNIAKTFGLSVSLTPLPKEKLSGKFSGANLADVLNELARNYRFDWFIHGGTLYLYGSSDWVTEKIIVGSRSDGSFRESLAAYGLLINKFKILEQPEQDAVTITGPRAYVKLIENAFKINVGANDSDLMMFKLKYASVEDRVITLRDKSVTTPGVATVLKNILSSPSRQTNIPTLPVTSVLPVSMPSMGMMPNMLDAAGASPAEKDAQNGRANSASNQQGGGVEGSGRNRANMAVVQSDPRTNSILIRDRSSKYQQYKALIDQLDVPMAMVEIEAVLIDIDQRKLDELGAEWGLTLGGKIAFDFPGGSVASVSGLPSPAASSSSASSSTSVISDRSRFAARIQALVANNDAKVLAKPTILTLDNLSAVIDLTQTFYTKVSGERVANVVPVTAGSLLRVTPRIIQVDQNRKEIQLSVDIEDGSLQDRAGIELPTVQKSSISTQASIKENQAILIGGYNRESEESVRYRVPFLSDLPIVGGLMQSRRNTSQKVTRLFLITPRLINNEIPSGMSLKIVSDLKK